MRSVPLTWLSLLLLPFPLLASRPAFPQESVPLDIEVWQTSSRLLDHYEVVYEITRQPSPELLTYLRENPPKAENQKEVAEVFSTVVGQLTVLRKGNQVRYHMFERSWALNTGLPSADPSDTAQASDTVVEFIQCHGDRVFFYYDIGAGSASIHADWPHRLDHPLSILTFPLQGNHSAHRADGENCIVEFRQTGDPVAVRYHLSPAHDMMPFEIQWYTIRPDGSLFLFRFFKVESYEKTVTGAYLPVESTFYDPAYAEFGEEPRWEMSEHYRILSGKWGIDIADFEFEFSVPPGTRVRDKISGVSYTAGKGPDEGSTLIDDALVIDDTLAGGDTVTASPARERGEAGKPGAAIAATSPPPSDKVASPHRSPFRSHAIVFFGCLILSALTLFFLLRGKTTRT